MAAPIIRTEQLERHFGKVEALKGIDMEVEAGSVRGLLGPNGAGKTDGTGSLETVELRSNDALDTSSPSESL